MGDLLYMPQHFSRGLASCVDEDSRIRTRIGQLTDSGRYTSSGPNLMNQHKKMEAELRRIFAIDEKELRAVKGWSGKTVKELVARGLLPAAYAAIRSCFMAPPGMVMIEADYKQAELNVLAYASGDPGLIAIMRDKSRDLHSEMAVRAFRLTCAPSEVSKLHAELRVAAKAVVFGIAYGRGAAAIVRQLRTDGIIISVQEAQGMIDTFFTMFPLVYEYVQRCKRAIYDPGYVETAWGRRRYFHPTSDRSINAGQEREAVNHRIQGTVAGCLDVALYNLRQYGRYVEPDLGYEVVLPVHDAVLMYARPETAEHVIDTVLPVCMVHGAKVPIWDMTLSIDTDIKERWDDHFTEEELHAFMQRVTNAA